MVKWFTNVTDETRTLRPFEAPGRRGHYVFSPGVPVLVQEQHIAALATLPIGVLVEFECDEPQPQHEAQKRKPRRRDSATLELSDSEVN